MCILTTCLFNQSALRCGGQKNCPWRISRIKYVQFFPDTKEQRGSRFLLSDCASSLCEARLCPRINDREAEIFITRTESR